MKVRVRTPLWRRALRRLGQKLFRLAENNDDPRFAQNGEQWLLQELLSAHARTGQRRPFVVFDAGANLGGYTQEVLRLAQITGCAVEVHLFEPSPRCLGELRRIFADKPDVRIVAGAVGAAAGQAMLYDGDLGSSLASLVPRDVLSGAAEKSVTVPVLALGDYLAEQGLTRVDLLKLDVEGFEVPALRGLGAWLRPDTIGLVQFEYGGAALDAGTTLRDLYELLDTRGYRIAKLFPQALEARAYGVWMEHYAYTNYVALPADTPP